MKSKLLLLHGALGSKKQFTPIIPFLTERFEVYDLNFEGHGGRETDNDYSIELFTQNAVDFLHENEIVSIDIFGYSMGGYVALNMAIHFPERVKKIVTLGTKFNWDKVSAEKEIRMLNPEKIREKVPAFAEKLKAEHHPADWETVVRKTASMMAGLAVGKRILDDGFKQIEHEVIIGIGTDDKMVTVEESERVAGLIPNGKLRVLEGVPHPIDQVEAGVLAGYVLNSFL